MHRIANVTIRALQIIISTHAQCEVCHYILQSSTVIMHVCVLAKLLFFNVFAIVNEVKLFTLQVRPKLFTLQVRLLTRNSRNAASVYSASVMKE